MFLAVVYASSGQVDQAIWARDEALRVAEHHVIPSVTVGAYYWVGAVNATLGDNEAAERYLSLAVDLARKVGSPYTLARFLPLVARRLHAVGNHAEAIQVFEEAIELSRSAGDRVGLVRSLQYMAERHIASGEYAIALERLDEARPIVSREIDDATLACRGRGDLRDPVAPPRRTRARRKPMCRARSRGPVVSRVGAPRWIPT